MNVFNYLRAGWRLAGISLHTLWVLVRLSYKVRRGMSLEDGLELRRRWAEGMMRILRFDIAFSGDFPHDEPCLYVSNHRSSLDPIAVMSRIKAFPISRAEVRHWPLVGKGSEMTGIIFVDKSSKESRRRTRTALLHVMEEGNSVLIYPEGQTQIEPTTCTFHKGSFEQAAVGGFRVVPHVIEYQYKEDYWDHKDNFAMHFLKRFGKKTTPIKVVFGPPISSDNPWTLLRNAQQWIDEKILEVRKQWDAKTDVE